MAYEAVDSLQQALLLILQRHDNVITPPVKQQIVSIHDKAVVLQFNLKHFPDKETIREVANTAKRIIEYLFSPLNLSDFGFKPLTVRLPDQLGELAKELDSTVGYVVDYCKINSNSVSDSPGVSSSSRSALKSQVDHLAISKELIVRDSNSLRLLGGRIKSAPSPVITRFSLKSQVEDTPVELIAINTYGLKRLAEKIKSTAIELADELKIVASDSIPISLPTNKDVFDVFGDTLNDSAAVASSSRPASTTKYFVVDSDEDLSDSPSIYPTTTEDDAVVGFDDDKVQMMARITHNSASKQQTLPIVGMGGIGKSTLAKYVYHHPMIMDQYDIRAWVTISQDYSIPSILSQLLASLKGKVERVERDSLKVIEAEKLEIKKFLSGRRYLIVIDDIWSVEAWNRIQGLFPDNDNRSRIILTTRLMDVATNATNSRNIHMMRFLDGVQSWRLFHDKVFGDQDCPIELQSVGEKIVKGCGGLPLSIVTVAGLLSRIPRTPKLWKQIEVNDGQLGSILSLSYNHLPLHLRKCFLYMAAFPQEYDIRASELIKLWVAEGYIIWRYASETVEVVAEKYLEDLIKQSLVLISSRKIDGKIKSCRLHSMVRDFCVRQARQEKFFLPVMDYFPTPILRRHFLPQVLQNHRRVSVSWHDLSLTDSMHSSCTTSIICIPQRGYRPKGSVENFTSLRVLHVLRRNDHSYWELGQVFKLIYLAYLASNIPDDIVPPAIAKLQNLQTLIIYRSNVCLPVEIWSLRMLRHLIAFSFQPLPLPKGATPFLKNLRTLSMAIDFVCSEKVVEMIPYIKKLGICYSQEKFGSGYYCLDNLIRFHQVEKLKLEMHSLYVPRLIFFPLSLKKLELSGQWISWRDMTIVGSLPNLQVLKLKNYACHGEHWETIDREFHGLILLLIDESNLKYWESRSSHFPRLKCLMLHRCPYLDEIPHDIGTFPSLELIEIDDHNQSLLYSANKIKAQHRNDRLKVVVKRS